MESKSVRATARSWWGHLYTVCAQTFTDGSFLIRYGVLTTGVLFVTYGVYISLLYALGTHYMLAWIGAYGARGVFKFTYIRWRLFGHRLPGRLLIHASSYITLDLINMALGSVAIIIFVEAGGFEPIEGMVASGAVTFFVNAVLIRYVFKPRI